MPEVQSRRNAGDTHDKIAKSSVLYSASLERHIQEALYYKDVFRRGLSDTLSCNHKNPLPAAGCQPDAPPEHPAAAARTA